MASIRKFGQNIQHWIATHPILMLALVGTFAYHGVTLFTGTYRGTYDAFVHMFFADHYARDWWSLWETRWYTGFTTVSYPPLSHQTTALLSKVFSIPTGFMIIMLNATVVTTLGIYRFSHLWVSQRQAEYAALLAVFSSSIAETVHVFGQLPTMFVIGIILNSLPFLWHWIDKGRRGDLYRSWALLMVACAGHHVTTIFGMVFFSGPIFATVLLRKFRTPRSDEPDLGDGFNLGLLPRLIWRRVRRVLPSFWRSFVFGIVFIMIAVTTVLPYWIWSRGDPITQITIPHGSRLSFIENPNIGLMFFLIPWGVLLFILPYAVVRGLTSRNWILTASLLMLSLLGTGGTTPIPAMLLGGAFYILTLDRFTFWATIVILPFAGQFVDSLLNGRVGRWLTHLFGPLGRVLTAGSLMTGLVVFSIFTANLTQFRKFQPKPLDMTPIVEFLAKDDHDKWRYMTLGFGDQLAWLSAQTTALNVEGNYHSARRLPEMTSTPIERLDGAKFQDVPGLGSLHQFITTPQRYNLKYIFVNDAFYEPLLHFAGWVRLGALENNVQVWERADVPPLPAAIPQQDYPDWQRLMWGIVPPGSLVVALLVFTLTPMGKPARDSELTMPENKGGDWQIWWQYLDRWRERIQFDDRAQRAVLLAIVGVLILLAVTVYFTFFLGEEWYAEDTLLAYYDAIDFKRFSESYDYLATDLTQEEYLRWLSLRGGLVASFSKLENVYFEVTYQGSREATATVQAEWLTALGMYPQTIVHPMIREDGRWRIVLDEPVPPAPRETLTVSTTPDFYINTPLVDLADGAFNRGTLNRSLLSVSPVEVVYLPSVPISFLPEPYDAPRIEGRFNGLVSVVGQVTNRDTYPAHVTVTAILRGGDGERIAENNAMDVMRHQLLPNETTPFRVDFAGASARDILQLSDIQSVDVIVQGVPTAYNLERPLIQIAPDTLYNSSSQAVDIPSLLVWYGDWVERVYLEQAIRPDNTGTFTLPEKPFDVTPLGLRVLVDGPRLVDWQEPPPYQIVVDGYIR